MEANVQNGVVLEMKKFTPMVELSRILTDEEIEFYGEQFQTSEDKEKGVPFQVYLEQQRQKKEQA